MEPLETFVGGWGLLVDADPALQTCVPTGHWCGWGCCWGLPVSYCCS